MKTMRDEMTTQQLMLKPPTEGVSYFLDGMYLSNEKDGAWPVDQPAELYLFMERWRGGKKEQRFVYTIEAKTEELALDKLREIASRADVTLVEEATHRVIPKDFLEAPSGKEA